MKNLITLIFLSLSTLVCGQTSKEIDMVVLVNQVRTNPKSFIEVVEEYMKSMTTSTKTIKTNGVTMTMTKKVDSELAIELKALIRFLSTVKPVKALELSVCMYTTTKIFATYLDSTKQVTHTGPNGQTFADRIKTIGLTGGENCTTGKDINTAMVLLLLDFKAKVKGHRNNIFDPKYTQISVANSGNYWVQDFIY